MKRKRLLAFLIVVLAWLTGCSDKDRVVHVSSDEPEMVAAIGKARETLPQFWQVFEKPDRGEAKFSLKVRIADKNGTEHFWLTDIERREGKMTGVVSNDPNIVSSVKLGQRIDIPEADISDWLYMRDGKMVGNETLKPLLKKMPAAEVQRLKSIMAEP